jgi:hypothetical protein
MHKYVLICEVNNTLPLLHCVLGANTLPKHKHLKPGGSRDVERLILGGGLNRPAQTDLPKLAATSHAVNYKLTSFTQPPS